jgi:hypothetical protein
VCEADVWRKADLRKRSDHRLERPYRLLLAIFHNAKYGYIVRPFQKCPAAKSPSRIVPQTANTATILIKFCVATDSIEAVSIGDKPVLDALFFEFLRFAFCGIVLAGMAFLLNGGVRPLSRPDPNAFPVKFTPICRHHGMPQDMKA